MLEQNSKRNSQFQNKIALTILVSRGNDLMFRVPPHEGTTECTSCSQIVKTGTNQLQEGCQIQADTFQLSSAADSWFLLAGHAHFSVTAIWPWTDTWRLTNWPSIRSHGECDSVTSCCIRTRTTEAISSVTPGLWLATRDQLIHPWPVSFSRSLPHSADVRWESSWEKLPPQADWMVTPAEEPCWDPTECVCVRARVCASGPRTCVPDVAAILCQILRGGQFFQRWLWTPSHRSILCWRFKHSHIIFHLEAQSRVSWEAERGWAGLMAALRCRTLSHCYYYDNVFNLITCMLQRYLLLLIGEFSCEPVRGIEHCLFKCASAHPSWENSARLAKLIRSYAKQDN